MRHAQGLKWTGHWWTRGATRIPSTTAMATSITFSGRHYVFLTSILKFQVLGFGLKMCSSRDLPRFNTVSFGKHSLRYLGPILWSKLDKNDKTCKSLSDFRNRMRNKDLTSLIDDGCKGCLLCDSWCLIGNNFSILALSFSILANNL